LPETVACTIAMNRRSPSGAMRRVPFALVIALPLCPAQTLSWAQIWADHNIIPAVRWGPSLAYDAGAVVSIMFGGRNNTTSTDLNDTWVFDVTTGMWGQRTPATVPPARNHAGMVYDPLRSRVVMYSMESNNPTPTWEWYANDWHAVVTSQFPRQDWGSSMVYDIQHQQVLQFGGQNFQFANWTYDGVNWTQQTTFPHPPGRAWGGMAYDSHRQRVVLFGGRVNNGGLTDANDTWEWDGVLWTQRLPLTSPPAREHFAMAYDSSRQRCVVYGGNDPNAVLFNDTWEWDGSNWTNTTGSTSPGGMADQAMTFDSSRNVVVMFGLGSTGTGSLPGNTYVYGPMSTGLATPFGQGCPGLAGTPVLQTLANTVPWAGLALELQLVNVGTNPAVNPAFIWLGLSDTMIGSLTLPLDLAFAGMPGCTLLASMDVLGATQNLANGVAFNTWLMPGNPGLLGIVLFAQGAEIDATANVGGAALSNALRLQLGGLY
jgi:hypothetical protein